MPAHTQPCLIFPIPVTTLPPPGQTPAKGQVGIHAMPKGINGLVGLGVLPHLQGPRKDRQLCLIYQRKFELRARVCSWCSLDLNSPMTCLDPPVLSHKGHLILGKLAVSRELRFLAPFFSSFPSSFPCLLSLSASLPSFLSLTFLVLCA